jgi:hypothetical protein
MKYSHESWVNHVFYDYGVVVIEHCCWGCSEHVFMRLRNPWVLVADGLILSTFSKDILKAELNAVHSGMFRFQFIKYIFFIWMNKNINMFISQINVNAEFYKRQNDSAYILNQFRCHSSKQGHQYNKVFLIGMCILFFTIKFLYCIMYILIIHFFITFSWTCRKQREFEGGGGSRLWWSLRPSLWVLP